jgi:hypothetical protein
MSDLYHAALALLRSYEGPLVPVIGGGFLRDLYTDRHPRDCDVFVEADTEAGLSAVAKASLDKTFGFVTFSFEIPEGYEGVSGLVGVGDAGFLDTVPINIIVLKKGRNPFEDCAQHDFGICQVWLSAADGAEETCRFRKDLHDQTFTLSVCESANEFARSMRRWEKLAPRFPGWTLVVPDEFRKYV